MLFWGVGVVDMTPKTSSCNLMKGSDTQRTTVWTSCLTYKLSLRWGNLAGFEDELALRVWRETLVQQQHPWTVCGTHWIPSHSSSQSSTVSPTIPNVAHLDAKWKLVT